MEFRDAGRVGIALLSLSAAAAAAGALAPRARRVVLGGAALGALAALAATFLMASLPVGRWMSTGAVPFSWYDSSLLVVAGLAAASAFLATGPLASPAGSPAAPPALASSSGSSLLATLLALLVLGADDSFIYATPATYSPTAVVFHTLHPVATGFLLSTVIPASFLLLPARVRPGDTTPWDAVLRRIVSAGLPLLVLSLVAECLWHGDAWSNPWSGDGTEKVPLLSLMTFLVWLHLRRAVPERLRTASALLVIGGIAHAGFWSWGPFAPGAVGGLTWCP